MATKRDRVKAILLDLEPGEVIRLNRWFPRTDLGKQVLEVASQATVRKALQDLADAREFDNRGYGKQSFKRLSDADKAEYQALDAKRERKSKSDLIAALREAGFAAESGRKWAIGISIDDAARILDLVIKAGE